MEVAYLRITYSSHGNISRYRYELHAALQVIPPGIYKRNSFIKFLIWANISQFRRFLDGYENLDKFSNSCESYLKNIVVVLSVFTTNGLYVNHMRKSY